MGIRKLGLLAGVLAVMAPAAVATQSAHAAAGVIGGFDTLSIVHGSSTDTLKSTGWAYNGSTVPSQEVQIRLSGEALVNHAVFFWTDYTSPTVVANNYDPTDQSKHGLHTAYVGYSINHTITKSGESVQYTGTVTACLWARDHGTTQAWRSVACRNLTT